MTIEKQTIKYEDIEDIPASILMELTFTELSGFIHQAERRLEKAKTLRNWLTWIKVEKALRYKKGDLDQGGAA